MTATLHFSASPGKFVASGRPRARFRPLERPTPVPEAPPADSRPPGRSVAELARLLEPLHPDRDPELEVTGCPICTGAERGLVCDRCREALAPAPKKEATR